MYSFLKWLLKQSNHSYRNKILECHKCPHFPDCLILLQSPNMFLEYPYDAIQLCYRIFGKINCQFSERIDFIFGSMSSSGLKKIFKDTYVYTQSVYLIRKSQVYTQCICMQKYSSTHHTQENKIIIYFTRSVKLPLMLTQFQKLSQIYSCSNALYERVINAVLSVVSKTVLRQQIMKIRCNVTFNFYE